MLVPGKVVVMDNCSIHHDDEVRYIVEQQCGTLDSLMKASAISVTEQRAAAGCRLTYLPHCSPDRNPIELAFSKVK